MWQISLDQTEKSAVADRSIKTGHCFFFQCYLNIRQNMDRLVQGAFEIRLKNNFNVGSGFILSRAYIL